MNDETTVYQTLLLPGMCFSFEHVRRAAEQTRCRAYAYKRLLNDTACLQLHEVEAMQVHRESSAPSRSQKPPLLFSSNTSFSGRSFPSGLKMEQFNSAGRANITELNSPQSHARKAKRESKRGELREKIKAMQHKLQQKQQQSSL